MEIRSANVIISKAGGNAGKNSYNCKVSLPKVWIDRLGITLDNRKVSLIFDEEQIIIKPSSGE